jgi:hypothetical protein
MMVWSVLQPGIRRNTMMDLLGFIPSFLNEDDPRPAREQLDEGYGFAGGWCPFAGFTMLPNGNLSFRSEPGEPDDPETLPLAETKLRDETIRVYEHAWVAVIQPDGSYEIARMD